MGPAPFGAKAAAAIRKAAKSLGLPVTGPSGAELWGGRALRRGGAQFFSTSLGQLQSELADLKAVVSGALKKNLPVLQVEPEIVPADPQRPPELRGQASLTSRSSAPSRHPDPQGQGPAKKKRR